MKRLSLKEKLTYACGNLGISLLTVIHMLFLVYFFFPPKDAGIPYHIPQTSFFMGITILGVVMSLGRIFDAFTDPLIAHLSDKSENKRGKRIPFLRKFSIPFAISYVAIFFVPVPGEISVINIIWLTIWLFLCALFLTLYGVPYFSLLVHIAKTSEDKVDLCTFSSAFWFAGFIIVSSASNLWDGISKIFGVDRLVSMQFAFALLAIIGLMCLSIPAYLINEKKYETNDIKIVNERLIPSLKKVLKNRNFICYLIGNTGYSIATYMFETGLIYFITVLAVLEAGVQGTLTLIIGALTLLCYPLINKMAKKIGKKIVMKFGFLLFALTFIVISFLGIGNMNVYILLGMIVLLVPYSQATFGILPSAITADCAAYDKYKSGEDKPGMYGAVNGFFSKLGGSLAMVIFTSLLLLGKDIGDDMGIRVIAIFGTILSFAGIIAINRYNEKEILSYTKQNEYFDENSYTEREENSDKINTV
ncbi:putative symporter YjmB [Vallitalea longa]|uniref:Symporter YjmB n=1 Tax=Vallitalea longa TaxID=2936439 RepID=A0A9W5YB04_9FIRM|nr:MFS transporter [Vallitalea longa]GKX30652.1 putative symporter YjmB [Vallitalea longa]